MVVAAAAVGARPGEVIGKVAEEVAWVWVQRLRQISWAVAAGAVAAAAGAMVAAGGNGMVRAGVAIVVAREVTAVGDQAPGVQVREEAEGTSGDLEAAGGMSAAILMIITTARTTTAAVAWATGGATAVGAAPNFEAAVACVVAGPAMTVRGTLEVAEAAVGDGVEAVCGAAAAAAVGVAGAEVRQLWPGAVGEARVLQVIAVG